MQVYKLFFQVLRKQKGQIIMYLVIFLSVALAAASQGEKTGEATFSPTTYKFAVMDADNSEISRALIAYLEQGNEKVHIDAGAENHAAAGGGNDDRIHGKGSHSG